MKSLRTSPQVVLFAVLFLLPMAADAQPILAQRCNTDSLDPAQAEARLKWARLCALNLHSDPSEGFPIGQLSDNGDGQLLDYPEDDSAYNPYGAKCYTGQLYNLEVNYSYIENLYFTGVISQTTDMYGFKEWSRALSRKRARPLYPTYGSTSDIYSVSNKQLFPHPQLANCMLYYDAAGTLPAATSGKEYYVNGYCESSCYTPEQRVLFSDGEVSILDALNARREDVMTLSPDSTLEDVQLEVGTTYSYTAEIRDSEHPIVELLTASGGQLRVTTEHPVINGEGRLVQAQTLKAGDELMRSDGTRDEIVEVRRTHHFGKVFNLRPKAESLISNVVVAQGYLVGSSYFQNDGINYINRQLLFRSSIPPEVIP